MIGGPHKAIFIFASRWSHSPFLPKSFFSYLCSTWTHPGTWLNGNAHLWIRIGLTRLYIYYISFLSFKFLPIDPLKNSHLPDICFSYYPYRQVFLPALVTRPSISHTRLFLSLRDMKGWPKISSPNYFLSQSPLCLKFHHWKILKTLEIHEYSFNIKLFWEATH